MVTKENQLIDILEDINTITDALTALDEGASVVIKWLLKEIYHGT